jgi:predicted membrane protein
MGVMTVTLSVLVAFKFSRYRANLKGGALHLSSAISLQLIGEAIIGFGTLIFSLAAYLGVLDSWSLEIQSLLRFVMFLATSITTWHLLRTLYRLGD